MKPPSFSSLKNNRLFMVAAVLLALVVVLAGVKALQIRAMVEKKKHFVPPPEVVTSAVATSETWENALQAVGSLAAVQGVTVAAETSGKVVRIAFAPGTAVKAGAVLIQQDTAAEEAQLRAANSAAELARLNLERYKGLLATNSIAQVTFDNAEAQHKQAVAQADAIRAVIAKKHIRAPFAGRLGIRLVNLGQVLKEGEPVVTLQALDPIFVNFQLPQQDLTRLQIGLPVKLTADTLADQGIEGQITTINPEVDSATRNLRVQATVKNPAEALRPGMFADVRVILPEQGAVVAIPATAVLAAPYGDSVFVIETKKDEQSGQPATVVRQQFVRLGAKRGDFVAVTSGLKEGETVVSSGVFKLRNGQAVKVDNTLAPQFQLAPKPTEG
ncbi:MAG TPA: efflux RND transporter periplasmic adaptor subunit [Desulfurivibrionaceae bacterium]|nr:efflux RND transporter periplasmic adaptor subunit [Desulfurivibrionaceae bacterium]